jgi:RsiW-degrading membrane proteinase PrsW (M82 family)
MIAIAPVLPLQGFAFQYIPMSFLLILVWAAIEEVMKFTIAYATVLRRHALDEPIDYPMYLITVALGFAALENALFLLTPLSNGHFSESIITGDLRFIGATLIHVLSSAIVGGALAFSFYREGVSRIWYGAGGVILAISLHAYFNFLIISTGAERLLTVFLGVWVGIIVVLLALERVKKIYRPAWWEKMFKRTNADI